MEEEEEEEQEEEEQKEDEVVGIKTEWYYYTCNHLPQESNWNSVQSIFCKFSLQLEVKTVLRLSMFQYAKEEDSIGIFWRAFYLDCLLTMPAKSGAVQCTLQTSLAKSPHTGLTVNQNLVKTSCIWLKSSELASWLAGWLASGKNMQRLFSCVCSYGWTMYVAGEKIDIRILMNKKVSFAIRETFLVDDDVRAAHVFLTSNTLGGFCQK